MPLADFIRCIFEWRSHRQRVISQCCSYIRLQTTVTVLMFCHSGFLAKVTVCGEVFESSQVRTRKVDAEQDAAKMAFEHLQQQQQQQEENDSTSAPSQNFC